MKVKLVDKETGDILLIEEVVSFGVTEAIIDCGKAGNVRKILPERTEYQTATQEEVAEYAAANGVSFDPPPATANKKK